MKTELVTLTPSQVVAAVITKLSDKAAEYQRFAVEEDKKAAANTNAIRANKWAANELAKLGLEIAVMPLAYEVEVPEEDSDPEEDEPEPELPRTRGGVPEPPANDRVLVDFVDQTVVPISQPGAPADTTPPPAAPEPVVPDFDNSEVEGYIDAEFLSKMDDAAIRHIADDMDIYVPENLPESEHRAYLIEAISTTKVIAGGEVPDVKTIEDALQPPTEVDKAEAEADNQPVAPKGGRGRRSS